MSVFAGKTFLPLEPKMSVALDALATTATPENLRPTVGPLAQLTYKPAQWRYLMRLSAVPTTGSVTINLMAGATVVRSEVVSVIGLSLVSNAVAVDLSQVAGETPLRVEVEVTAAADAGITATVDAVVSIDQPVTISGC